MARQSFGDFLNSAPPGRGRGSPRGGPSRGRGGGGRGGGDGSGLPSGRGRGGARFATDFTSVGFDYSALNRRGYVRFDSIPTGPPSGISTPVPRGRGGFAPRGRGRGGLGHVSAVPDSGTSSPGAGASTPVTGLGYHGSDSRGRGRGGRGRGGGTLGRGLGGGADRVTWGGGWAPLFVKAGELFREGEADVITLQPDGIHVEQMPMDDPSAPQMVDLQDTTEVDVSAGLLDVLAAESHAALDIPSVEALSISDTPSVLDNDSVGASALAVEAITTSVVEQHVVVSAAISSSSDDTEDEGTPEGDGTMDDAPLFFVDTTGDAPPSSEPSDPFFVDESGAGESDHFTFSVDTTGADFGDRPLYDAPAAEPLGTTPARSSSPEEEEIILRPRTFAEPQPLAVPVPASAGPSGADAPIQTRVSSSEPAMLKAHAGAQQFKSAKKGKKSKGAKVDRVDKRGRAKGRRREAIEGSDVEWGSDGAPDISLDVAGADIDDEDEMVLRDYLRGTLATGGDDDNEDEADPDISLDDLSRFGAGMARIGRENNVVDLFESQDRAARAGIGASVEAGADENEDGESEGDDSHWGSDSDSDGESSEIDADVVGKGKQRAPHSNPRPVGFIADAQFAAMADELGSDGLSSDEAFARALQAAEDAGLVSDSDEDGAGTDALFTGKDDWDETQWFLDAMDDSLDGIDMRDRSKRNKVFRAVQNGDFGDDWALTPAPKGKKKVQGVPAALQDQWERDRQKKAEKKRARELERLLAELDPGSRAVTAKGVKHKGAKGGKGAKSKTRVDKAALAAVAHLIPGSAAEVADMFDVSSDDDAPAIKRGRLALLPKTMEQVDTDLRVFLEDGGRTTLSLPPMDKEGRKKIHLLAEAYNLKSKSRGAGAARFTVIIKTQRSGLAVDTARIETLLAASAYSGGAFYKALHTKKRDGKKAGGTAARGSAATARLREGETVGEGADRIGEGNIGHRLLSMMGWSEGDRIGRTGGLDVPILAVVKNTKSGLGA